MMKKKVKIGFDAKRFFHNHSGLGNYSRDLVRIMATFSKYDEYFLFSKKKSEKGKDILEFPNVHYCALGKSVFARQLTMGKKAQNLGLNLFHGLSGELPVFSKNKPIKKVVTIHDLIFVRYPHFYSFFDRKIHFFKFKKAVEMADLVIAISEQTKRDIVEFLKIPEKKIKVIYQGCHHVFKKRIEKEKLQKVAKQYQLPERFILNVGTIEERKNLFSVVKALEGTEIPLVVIGKKTEYFNRIENFIYSKKMNVLFLESITMEELAAIYQLAILSIYPSVFEGFGIPVIESLFSETPVITSCVSCLPEAGGQAALYVNPDDVEDIRSKILFLWNHQEERERRKKIGIEFVQKFNDDVIFKNLMEAYESLF